MTRTLFEAQLTTANSRSKLKSGLHWRAIDPEIHLGYRKGVRGGRWLVRFYQGGQAYRQATLTTADDAMDADGVSVLDYRQAEKAARELVAKKRADALAEADGPALTVRNAIEKYLNFRERREVGQRGRAIHRDARSRLTKYVTSAAIADKTLHEITERDLKRWHDSLPERLAAATVRRLANDFKAALNFALGANRHRLPATFEIAVKAGLKSKEARATVARKQILPDPDVRRLIAAAWEIDTLEGWDGDLARLILVLAATGARFSQLIRLTVSNVQLDKARLMVPVSHKGRGEKAQSEHAVRIGSDVIDALRPAITGRKGHETLLLRWRSKQVAGIKWERDRRGPWQSASEFARSWRKIVARAGLAGDTVPYALRHSSIVRGLRAGLPVRLVAALHDTSSVMIERHYAAFVIDAMDELAGRAVIPLTATGATVIRLEKASG